MDSSCTVYVPPRVHPSVPISRRPRGPPPMAAVATVAHGEGVDAGGRPRAARTVGGGGGMGRRPSGGGHGGGGAPPPYVPRRGAWEGRANLPQGAGGGKGGRACPTWRRRPRDGCPAPCPPPQPASLLTAGCAPLWSGPANTVCPPQTKRGLRRRSGDRRVTMTRRVAPGVRDGGSAPIAATDWEREGRGAGGTVGGGRGTGGGPSAPPPAPEAASIR